MKIIFMGTPDFATASLRALVEGGHDVVLVVTQPDKPKGRGHKLCPPPVKEYAIEAGIEVYQPQSVKTDEAYEKLSSYGADIFVVAAYGQILPERVLNISKHGSINVHASLLPKYRGAAPIQWSIANGESVTGVTIMQMDKGLDTGDMLLKTEVEITETETGETLHDKLAIAGADVLLETLNKIENGTIVRTPQDDSLSCYAPMLDKQTSKIDFTKSPKEIVNLIRAMNPYPAAHTQYNEQRMRIFCAKAATDNTDAECGTILGASTDGIKIKCAGGAVVATQIQFDGKKRMAVSEYLKGNRIDSGVILK